MLLAAKLNLCDRHVGVDKTRSLLCSPAVAAPTTSHSYRRSNTRAALGQERDGRERIARRDQASNERRHRRLGHVPVSFVSWKKKCNNMSLRRIVCSAQFKGKFTFVVVNFDMV